MLNVLRKITDLPEFNIAVFSFLLHFVWEMLQIPAFVGMTDINHWAGVKLCAMATIGDVGIALFAFWLASVIAGTRHWIKSPTLRDISVFLIAGIAVTIGAEYYYTHVIGRWAYSSLMPLVPPFDTGLMPILQWIILPLIVVWFANRQTRSDAEHPDHHHT